MPDGLKGLVTIGAVAAALSSSNSVLGAMASVAIEDIYKPWKSSQEQKDESYYLQASRVAVVLFAFLLSLMAMLSYYWQHYTNLPLLSFALGVMTFAYSGLIGVYSVAIFTNLGSERGVRYALIGGFGSVLLMQPYISGIQIGFAWQLVIGSLISFIIMLKTN
jgi:Na+/proline symporter